MDRCCLPKLIEYSTTATSSFSRYVEVVKYRILSPLRLDPKFSNLGPLLVVAVKLLETGWIWSLRDLEEYMISRARVRSPNPDWRSENETNFSFHSAFQDPARSFSPSLPRSSKAALPLHLKLTTSIFTAKTTMMLTIIAWYI